MHVALVRFADMQDADRIYEAGEQYPRPDFDVTPERLAELEGSDNLAGKPLIVRVKEPEPASARVEAEKPKPARKRVRKNA